VEDNMNVQRSTILQDTRGTHMPRTAWPDSTIALARDPYRFISRTCDRLDTDVFETHLLLQRAICMRGKEAAELICDLTRFVRHGASPRRISNTLVGRGGVHGLDGEAHRHRKAMFLAVTAPERVSRLASITAARLREHARGWESRGRVTLYDELRVVLTRSVCAWAGVPLDEREVQQRTTELTALFDQAGSIGPAHWRARLARTQAERWCGEIIEQVRSSRLQPAEDTALHTIAWHHERDGTLLDAHTAAVELLNVLRPTVAVSVFLVFAAMALDEHPGARERLVQDDAYLDAFVQEVRRFYPFFPSIPARVKDDFEWHGYHFPRGVRVILDLYGTNHDRRLWDAPDTFRPERFLDRVAGAYALVPQGPGDQRMNHRCPGEGITGELMKVALRFLCTGIRYHVPLQDLGLDWRRLPALPRSRFVLSKVSAVA
jgi:fatty-acid peroxygenase